MARQDQMQTAIKTPATQSIGTTENEDELLRRYVAGFQAAQVFQQQITAHALRTIGSRSAAVSGLNALNTSAGGGGGGSVTAPVTPGTTAGAAGGRYISRFGPGAAAAASAGSGGGGGGGGSALQFDEIGVAGRSVASTPIKAAPLPYSLT